MKLLSFFRLLFLSNFFLFVFSPNLAAAAAKSIVAEKETAVDLRATFETMKLPVALEQIIFEYLREFGVERHLLHKNVQENVADALGADTAKLIRSLVCVRPYDPERVPGPRVSLEKLSSLEQRSLVVFSVVTPAPIQSLLLIVCDEQGRVLNNIDKKVLLELSGEPDRDLAPCTYLSKFAGVDENGESYDELLVYLEPGRHLGSHAEVLRAKVCRDGTLQDVRLISLNCRPHELATPCCFKDKEGREMIVVLCENDVLQVCDISAQNATVCASEVQSSFELGRLTPHQPCKLVSYITTGGERYIVAGTAEGHYRINLDSGAVAAEFYGGGCTKLCSAAAVVRDSSTSAVKALVMHSDKGVALLDPETGKQIALLLETPAISPVKRRVGGTQIGQVTVKDIVSCGDSLVHIFYEVVTDEAPAEAVSKVGIYGVPRNLAADSSGEFDGRTVVVPHLNKLTLLEASSIKGFRRLPLGPSCKSDQSLTVVTILGLQADKEEGKNTQGGEEG